MKYSAHNIDTDWRMYDFMLMQLNSHVEWLINQEVNRDSLDLDRDFEDEDGPDCLDAMPCGNIMVEGD